MNWQLKLNLKLSKAHTLKLITTEEYRQAVKFLNEQQASLLLCSYKTPKDYNYLNEEALFITTLDKVLYEGENDSN